VDLADARRRLGHKVAFQGNVSNRLLVDGTPDEIDAAVRACIQAGDHQGHILNLSHGLLKESAFDNVCRLIDTCRTTVLERPAAA
jgi:uroporphyrinogen decarboxylase